MKTLCFRSEDAKLEISLLQRAEDVYVGLEVSSNGFAGRNDLYVSGSAFRAFCKDLDALEQTLRGESVLESISPNELKLAIRSANGRGYVAVEGAMGYWAGHDEFKFWHSVTFGFIVEPQQFAGAVASSWLSGG